MITSLKFRHRSICMIYPFVTKNMRFRSRKAKADVDHARGLREMSRTERDPLWKKESRKTVKRRSTEGVSASDKHSPRPLCIIIRGLYNCRVCKLQTGGASRRSKVGAQNENLTPYISLRRICVRVCMRAWDITRVWNKRIRTHSRIA